MISARAVERICAQKKECQKNFRFRCSFLLVFPPMLISSMLEYSSSLTLEQISRLKQLVNYDSHDIKSSHVATAVVLVVATIIYRAFSYPKQLSHIAHIPAWPWLSSIIR